MRFSIACLGLLAICLALPACATDDDPYDSGLEFQWPSGNPDRYHWDGFSDPFFETWTWHVALPESNASFAVTMGVFNPGADNEETRGALVHFSSSLLDEAIYAILSPGKFDASVQEGDVRIGDSRGSPHSVSGAIPGPLPVSFNFHIDVDEEWEDTMGFLTNMPLLPFNWHVGALRAWATGSVTIGDEHYSFSNTPVMEDHFWGEEFPGVSTRILAYNFLDPENRLALLIKDLLLGPLDFPEIYLALRFEGRLYEMRTLDLNVTATHWRDTSGDLHVEMTKGNFRVHVLVLDGESPATPGWAFDEEGFREDGELRQAAVVQVDVLSRAGGEDWKLLDTIVSTLSTHASGVPSPYQDIP